jgi:hypothetical protein
MKLDPVAVNETISKFHLEQRVFQMSEINDVDFGYAPSWGVFNKDQVPLQCSSKMATTLNERGANFIWNVLWNPDEKYRFATMNLTVPMTVIGRQMTNCRMLITMT